MKIAIIDSTIHEKTIGGAQIYLPSLLKGLVEKGYDVQLVAAALPNSVLLPILNDIGIRLHTNLWKEWSLPIDKARSLAGWLNNLRPDIFVVSVSADVGWLCLPLLRPFIRTAAIAHNDLDAFYLPAAHYKKFLTGVIGVSEEICRKYELVSGIEPCRIQWIPYGVNSSTGVPVANYLDPINIIYVGRLEEEQKRISDVRSLIMQLSEAGINFFFQIIGDGSMRNWLQDTFTKQIRNGQVSFTGWISNENIQIYYQKSDVFILTSSYEGFSIALTEAMANGCCPVVTDIPSGSKQLVQDGLNGFLLPVGDISGFVDRIKLLEKDRKKLIELRKAAWETGRQYSVKAMVNRYASWFERIIDTYAETDKFEDHNFPVMASCQSRYPDWIRRIKVLMKRAGIIGLS